MVVQNTTYACQMPDTLRPSPTHYGRLPDKCTHTRYIPQQYLTSTTTSCAQRSSPRPVTTVRDQPSISGHHPSRQCSIKSNNVYPSRGALRSLSMPLPQTLTGPMCSLWFSQSRHHRKSSICWLQMPDTFHRTSTTCIKHPDSQHQDAEPLKPFPVSKLAAIAASQA